MVPDLPTLYWWFVTLRFVLVFIPETGLVHPDEYIQSTEILARRMFKVEGHISSDFDDYLPIRGIALKFHTIGTTFQIYKLYSDYEKILNPYLLLIGPRITMCFFSFLIDWSLYAICVANNEPYKHRMVILATSYVMYVHAIRPLTNTFEMICLSLILYFVAEAIICTNDFMRNKDYMKFLETTIKRTQQRRRLAIAVKSRDYRNSVYIATIAIYGFFTHPTFCFFAMFPIFLWLCRGIATKYNNRLIFICRLIVLIICCVPAFWFNMIVDTTFFEANVNNDLFIITPWNYMKYKVFQLELYPNFLDLAVNLHICFNILAVVAIGWILWAFRRVHKLKYYQLPTVRSIRGMMFATFVGSIIIFSSIPPQEPRTLIPLIIPLIYLYGNHLYPEPFKMLKTKDEVSTAHIPLRKGRRKFAMYLWVLVNLICALFYGFVNQAGIYPAMKFIHKTAQSDNKSSEFFVGSSFSYPLPQSLALRYLESNPVTGWRDRRFHVYDMGKNVTTFNETMDGMYDEIRNFRYFYPHIEMKCYYLIPSLITEKYELPKPRGCKIEKLLKEVPMHFSYEVLQLKTDDYFVEIMEWWKRVKKQPEMYRDHLDDILKVIYKVPYILSLQIWEIDCDL